MNFKNPNLKIISLLFFGALALSACGDAPISDDAANAANNAAVGVDSPAEADDEVTQEVEPVVVFTTLNLQEDGRVKCEYGDEPGEGMVIEYTLDAEKGPYDENHACVRALTSIDQDALREADALASNITSYLDRDLGVDTKKLESTLKELETALEGEWADLSDVSAAADEALGSVEKAVKEKKEKEEREAEAKRQAEAQKQAEAAKPAPKKPAPKATAKPKTEKPKAEKPKPKAAAKPSASSVTGTVLAITNKYRANAGLLALKADGCAEKWASSHSSTQAQKSSMHHQNLGPILGNCGGSAVGENVAAGYGSAAAAAEGWFASPGHKANMLDKRFTHMGAAVSYGADGRPYYTQVFLKR